MPTRRELFCAKAFDRFLSNHLEGPMPCWEPPPPGKDPPDFYLKLALDTYAVEVTSTQVWRKPAVGDLPILEETFEASHREIALAAEREALKRNLSGRYFLSFDQPIASSDFPKFRDALVAELVTAIQASQSEPPPWSTGISIRDVEFCWLFRGGNGPITVHITTGDGPWTESLEFLALVAQMLGRAVSDKASKLAKNGVRQPAILLLLNTFMRAAPSHYLAAIATIPETESFHTIFLVHGDGGGTILQSKDPNWEAGRP